MFGNVKYFFILCNVRRSDAGQILQIRTEPANIAAALVTGIV